MLLPEIFADVTIFYTEFNGELLIIYKIFYSRPYIGLKLWEFVWLRVVKATIVAYAVSVCKTYIPIYVSMWVSQLVWHCFFSFCI